MNDTGFHDMIMVGDSGWFRYYAIHQRFLPPLGIKAQ